jgi:ABC-2 type transport system ATP-binding protein
VVGFLGPNGAGKTTTMRILTGYMPATAGAAYIAGFNTLSDSIAARQRLGYLPETIPLYSEMTVEGYLAFVGRIRRLPNLWDRVDDVLESVNLLDRAESYIGALSKGMRQRVGLAQALLHDPDVLILDEPTIGLDPRQVVELREMIKVLGKRHTILLSTHILSEVEQVCDRVIMVIDGRIWADMPLADIVGERGEKMMSVQLANPAADAIDLLRRIEGVNQVRQQANGELLLSFSGRDDTRTSVAELAVNSAWGLLELSVDQVSLESVFLDKLKEAEASRTEIVESEAEEEQMSARSETGRPTQEATFTESESSEPEDDRSDQDA